MKKNFKKLGLKILAGLLLCSCTLGSKAMAMDAPNGNPEEKPLSRQQRRYLAQQIKKNMEKQIKTKRAVGTGNYIPRLMPQMSLECYTGPYTPGAKIQIHTYKTEEERQAIERQVKIDQIIFNSQRKITTYQSVCGRQLTIDLNTMTPENVKPQIYQFMSEAFEFSKEYWENPRGDDREAYLPILSNADGSLTIWTDSKGHVYYCYIKCLCKDWPIHRHIDIQGCPRDAVQDLHQQLCEFLDKIDCRGCYYSYIYQMFESARKKQLTTHMKEAVQTKLETAELAEKEKIDKLTKEKEAAEERKKLMAIYPPDYNASSLDEFAMMISDEKLQEAQKKLEETDKAWLAEKIAKKRPVAYLPETKEPAELSPLEMNPNYIPIPNTQALFPFCSSQHNAFASLYKFLKENPYLEKQTFEVCEQVINHFGTAQCPVRKLQDRFITFDNSCKPLALYELYINDAHRALFVKLDDGPIQFIQFGGHM